jgi:hypothetical protein
MFACSLYAVAMIETGGVKGDCMRRRSSCHWTSPSTRSVSQKPITISANADTRQG